VILPLLLLWRLKLFIKILPFSEECENRFNTFSIILTRASDSKVQRLQGWLCSIQTWSKQLFFCFCNAYKSSTASFSNVRCKRMCNVSCANLSIRKYRKEHYLQLDAKKRESFDVILAYCAMFNVIRQSATSSFRVSVK
jgi:hypothetical protein